MKVDAVNLGTKIRRALFGLLALCAWGALFVASAWGLDRDRTITQFHHTAWTAKEGAPEQIRTLAQTTDGYLWLGTTNGLYRFDGIQFEHYRPMSGGDLQSSNIYSLLATPDGGLWISYWYGGLSFLKDGNLTSYGSPEGLPPGRVYYLAREDDGAIWAAVHGGLSRFDGSNWQQIGQEWNFTAKTAITLFFDRIGTLWVATDETILFLPKGTRSFQSTGEKIGWVLQITQSPEGAIWIAETTRAVRQLRLPRASSLALGPEIRIGSAAILFDRDGALWATSIGDGVRRLPHTDRFRGEMIAQFSADAEIFTESDGLTANYIYTVLEDREGNIWMGTANGLDRFRNSSFVPVRFPPGEKNFALAAGDEGGIWILSQKHLWMMDEGESTPGRILPNDGGLSFFRDGEGMLWIDRNHSIWGIREDGSKVVEHPKPSKNRNVTQIFKDRGDRLWAYFEFEGLMGLKSGVWERYEKQSELPRSEPIVVTIDSLDRKWLGYAGNAVSVIDGDRVRTYSVDDGLRVGDVKAICERSGYVWVAGTLGVAVFEEDRFRTLATAEAEVFGGISGIVEARDGSLWLNASRGIIHIPTVEVRAMLADPGYTIRRYRIFDFLDGLTGSAQQVRPFPTAVEGTSGVLWFSTSKGVLWIDPQQIPKVSDPPPVFIRSVTADEKSYQVSAPVELPEGTTRVQIDFTALSLSIPERIHFKYKLDGVDAGWLEGGTRRQAFYNSLAPGKYQFRVIAANQDGVWNEEGAILSFTIRPMFYQTVWFGSLVVLLAVLLVAGIAILLHRWRLARATERLSIGFEERIAERTRIAHDLHDTLLQGFFGAVMRLQGVLNLLPERSEKARENLDEVLEQIDDVLEDGRRAIWDMHALTIEDVELGEAFRLAGEDLSKAYGAGFDLTVEGEERPLSSAVRDQIYRIGREALINAFRHSKANKIEIEIEYAAKHLRIMIRDDGRGISPDYLSAGREGHLGLSGMREQSEKIGGELKIWSREDGGTEVELIVPRHVAFRKPASSGWFSRIKRL